MVNISHWQRGIVNCSEHFYFLSCAVCVLHDVLFENADVNHVSRVNFPCLLVVSTLGYICVLVRIVNLGIFSACSWKLEGTK